MPAIATDRAAFRQVTPYLVYCVAVMALGETIFGLDGSAFASFQILPSWLNVFGEPNARGVYSLSTDRRSLMTSIQWVGKLAGTVIVEPLVHRCGYKICLYVAMSFHFVGCILEIATHDWRVFSVGRVFHYVCIGVIENAGPTYIVEASPAPLRAFFVVLIFFAQALGGVIMNCVFQGISTMNSPISWYIPIFVAIVPGIMVCVMTPFIVESPRLLVSWGRKEDAVKATMRLRKTQADLRESAIVEVDEMDKGIKAQEALGSQAGWADLFKGNNARRTTIACVVFFFNQWTGQQFVTSYGPTFYASYGLGSLAFTYTIIGRVLNLIFSMPVAFLYDRYGRRPCVLVFVSIATIWLILVGALGGSTSASSVNVVVASIILFTTFTAMGWSKACWIVGPEIGSVVLRKKTMAFATFWDVIAAFGVTYSSPYMLAAIGNKVGYVFTAISVLSIVWAALFLPETRGRSLEELDLMFEKKLWAWQFKRYEVTATESGMPLDEVIGEFADDDKKLDTLHVERTEARV